MKKFQKRNKGDKVFYFLVTLILTVFFLMVLYPCLFVIAASFSSSSAVQAGKVYLWPVDFSLVGYEIMLQTKDVWTGFANSVFYTVTATAINLVMTMLCAYALARDDMPGGSVFMMYFTFTMFFSGGMIPNYLLVKNLGFLNTRWAILIPGALNVYNMIIARTYIRASIPEELLEASRMDGCSDFRYMCQVVLPLSKAVMAVLVLYYGVAHWNEYFNAMIYLTNEKLYPLTIFLREILQANTVDPSTVSDPEMQMKLAELANVMKYSLIVITMIPIMMIYPFVQKYFVKGVMIGAVKG